MRKRYRVLLFAALVVALIVPVGFALSLDSRPSLTHVSYSGGRASAVAVPVAPWSLPDAAQLLGVGTLLFGLAAMVRKTTS